MIKVPYHQNLELPEQPCGYMDHYLWMNNGYEPKAAFYFAYNEEALRVRLVAAVTEPLVLALKDNGEIWEDNCLELFWQPFPDHPDYFNFECNALGYMIIGKGPDREHRSCCLSALKPQMEVYTVVRPGKEFEVNYTIPFAAVEKLFGKPFHPQKGDTFRFNTYICGESTKPMHFGMWSPIDVAEPDFHRPEYFGEGMFD